MSLDSKHLVEKVKEWLDAWEDATNASDKVMAGEREALAEIIKRLDVPQAVAEDDKFIIESLNDLLECAEGCGSLLPTDRVAVEACKRRLGVTLVVTEKEIEDTVNTILEDISSSPLYWLIEILGHEIQYKEVKK